MVTKSNFEIITTYALGQTAPQKVSQNMKTATDEVCC